MTDRKRGHSRKETTSGQHGRLVTGGLGGLGGRVLCRALIRSVAFFSTLPASDDVSAIVVLVVSSLE